jgi:CoA-transferase family III
MSATFARADPATATATATARAALRGLVERLGLPPVREAEPGADLVAARELGLPQPAPPRLLRTADGWVHPGPPTAWADFTAMCLSLGATPGSGALPVVSSLRAEAIDAEAAAWLLPAVAVRPGPAAPPALPPASAPPDVTDARVVVLGTAWATPLVGLLLARLGARVTRVDDPRRVDPFPLRDRLAADQARVAPDLTTATGRAELAGLLDDADLVVDGYTPRVLANLGFGDDALDRDRPVLSRLRIAAFAHDDRPGYGPAAECRGGWAARTNPPALGPSSVADPVAGCLGAVVAVSLLADSSGGGGDGEGGRASRAARLSLEEAVGYLLACERREPEG